MADPRRPERYPPLPDFEEGRRVNPHPDGQPWRKACGQCLLRTSDPQGVEESYQRIVRYSRPEREGLFYCTHRDDGGAFRVCASFAACRAGEHRKVPGGDPLVARKSERVRGQHYEIVSSDTVVWVNGSDGMCIGRFSERGVDVHRNARDQARGLPQCLDCIHDLAPVEAWDRFVESMNKHHGVKIDPKWTPGFVLVANADAVDARIDAMTEVRRDV